MDKEFPQQFPNRKNWNENTEVDSETLEELANTFEQNGRADLALKCKEFGEIKKKEDDLFLEILERKLKKSIKNIPLMDVVQRENLDDLWQEFEKFRSQRIKIQNRNKDDEQHDEQFIEIYAKLEIDRLNKIKSLLKEIGQHEAGEAKVNFMIGDIEEMLGEKDEAKQTGDIEKKSSKITLEPVGEKAPKRNKLVR